MPPHSAPVSLPAHRRSSHVAGFDEEGLGLLSRRVTNAPEALRAIFVELGGEARVAVEAAFGVGGAGGPARGGGGRGAPRASAPGEGGRGGAGERRRRRTSLGLA